MDTGNSDRTRIEWALVFDFDGTLVDSSDIKQRAFKMAIGEATHAPAVEIQEAYNAHGTLNRRPQLANAYRDLVGQDPRGSELEMMVSRYGSFVQAHSDEVRLFPGMRKFLASSQEKYHLAIASNAPQAELSATCDALGIKARFDHVFGYPTSKADAIETVRSFWMLPKSSVVFIADRLEDSRIADHVGVPFCRFGPLELEVCTDIVRTVADLERAIDAVVSA